MTNVTDCKRCGGTGEIFSPGSKWPRLYPDCTDHGRGEEPVVPWRRSAEDKPKFLTRDELHAKALERWGRVADKMAAFGDALGKVGDAVHELTEAMDRIGNEFDALGPILDELEQDAEDTDEH